MTRSVSANDPRNQDAEARNRSDFGAGETIEGDAAAKNEPLKLIRGSGNVYLDLTQGDSLVRCQDSNPRPLGL
jgi:hypothetical protein